MENVINEILMASGVSKTRFAKDLGISKSYVINVINGKKKCSRSMYEKIRSLNYVNVNQKNELDYAFYCDLFGIKNYKLILQLIDLLNNYDTSFNDSKTTYVRTDFLESIFSGENVSHTINGKNELFELIIYFTQKCLDNDSPFYYTNFDFSLSELDQLIFTIFRDRDYSNKINFEHLIKYNQNHPDEILDSIFKSIKWGRILLNTSKTLSSVDNIGNLFPYYIITNDSVILFNADCETGIVLSSKQVISYYAELFIKEKEAFIPVYAIIEDEAVCLGQTDTFSNVNYIKTTFGGPPCLGPFLSYEVLDNIAYEIPQREQLIKMFLAHYKPLFEVPKTEYISEDGYWKFVYDGDILAVTDKYVGKCSYQDRAKTIRSIIESNENKNGLNVRLIDDSQVKLPPFLGIDCFDNTAIISSFFKNEPCSQVSKPYILTMSVDYSEFFWFHELIDNLQIYFEQKNLVLSPDSTKRAFERMIAKCEGLEADNLD